VRLSVRCSGSVGSVIPRAFATCTHAKQTCHMNIHMQDVQRIAASTSVSTGRSTHEHAIVWSAHRGAATHRGRHVRCRQQLDGARAPRRARAKHAEHSSAAHGGDVPHGSTVGAPRWIFCAMPAKEQARNAGRSEVSSQKQQPSDLGAQKLHLRHKRGVARVA
jgi:hypothetical protein